MDILGSITIIDTGNETDKLNSKIIKKGMNPLLPELSLSDTEKKIINDMPSG